MALLVTSKEVTELLGIQQCGVALQLDGREVRSCPARTTRGLIETAPPQPSVLPKRQHTHPSVVFQYSARPIKTNAQFETYSDARMWTCKLSKCQLLQRQIKQDKR